MITDHMRQFNEELIEEVREYRENGKNVAQRMHLPVIFFIICN